MLFVPERRRSRWLPSAIRAERAWRARKSNTDRAPTILALRCALTTHAAATDGRLVRADHEPAEWSLIDAAVSPHQATNIADFGANAPHT
jgi:hypothetical protein